MIHAVITHIGQSLDLKKRAFDHTIKLALPDGTLISATVDERAVEQLMKFVAEGSDEPAEPPSEAADHFADALYDGEAAHVFGGQVEQDDPGERHVPIDPPAATTGWPQQPPAQPFSPPPQPVRVKTVPKDEYGYPLVQTTGVSAGDVLADPIEEDGVPQL